MANVNSRPLVHLGVLSQPYVRGTVGQSRGGGAILFQRAIYSVPKNGPEDINVPILGYCPYSFDAQAIRFSIGFGFLPSPVVDQV